jgi:alkylation response protein AidB-like acyl-CoA dehydrogenase
LTPRVLSYITSTERDQSYLRPLTTFGAENKQTSLVTSEGWRALQELGIREGVIGLGHEVGARQWNSRVYQFVKYHIWSGSSAMVTCPNAMTDGAAVMLARHLNEENGDIFAEARRRAISREVGYAWSSGQWMTERIGGSDIRGTETVARKLEGREKEDGDGTDAVGMPLGPWRIDGFKWFSSATDANMAILLAKTGRDGKLSAFYGPLWRRPKGDLNGEIELNGVRIQRLKNKMGTKGLPTAELELKGMRGYLVGREGQGVKEISALLNITRIHNVMSAVGFWGRGLAIARAFARVRVTSGRLLMDTPVHVKALAQEHVKYRAEMQLSFFLVALLGRSEKMNETMPTAASAIFPKGEEAVSHILRFLTPLAKAQTALAAIGGLRECMESLGGIGYLENEDPVLNVARLYRDCNVLSIWEGTTNVMADDVIRVVKGRDGLEVLKSFDAWVKDTMDFQQNHLLGSEVHRLLVIWRTLSKELRDMDKEELKWNGRAIMQDLEVVVCGVLLLLDAVRDHDEVAVEIAKRWMRKDEKAKGWEREASWDRRIVFGDDINANCKL